MVSKKTVKPSKPNRFSPFFLHRRFVLINASGTRRLRGQKCVCELRYLRTCDRPKNSNLIEKMVSKKSVKPSKPNRFSPFFLHRRFV
jgi:hypothetical protein